MKKTLYFLILFTSILTSCILEDYDTATMVTFNNKTDSDIVLILNEDKIVLKKDCQHKSLFDAIPTICGEAKKITFTHNNNTYYVLCYSLYMSFKASVIFFEKGNSLCVKISYSDDYGTLKEYPPEIKKLD